MILNRELSWLDFNDRVLLETQDPVVPKNEKPKFSAIFASNLDEFYQVRVDAVMHEMLVDPDASKAALLEEINAKAKKLVAKQEKITKKLLGEFGSDFTIIRSSNYTAEHKKILKKLFRNTIFPVLTPMAVDFSRPFPLLKSGAIYVAAELEVRGERHLALIQSAAVLGRLIHISGKEYTLLEDIVEHFASELFSGYEVLDTLTFRILRSGDIVLEEDYSEDLLYVVEEALKHRMRGEVMRLDYHISPERRKARGKAASTKAAATGSAKTSAKNSAKAEGTKAVASGSTKATSTKTGGAKAEAVKAAGSAFIEEPSFRVGAVATDMQVETDSETPWLLSVLKKALDVHESSVFEYREMLDYTFLFKLPIKPVWKVKPKKPIGMDKKNIFKNIAATDIFLHHPYESFDPVVKFISDAAKDENVLAIKQTLYRVSGNSPIIRALAEAAEAGKQVTVLVELLARFDEENNINWAKTLEKKGAHVIYGVYGLKTHSKITLVVRREKNGIRRYVHLGTGNYNDKTAKQYTDMAYMTAREDYGSDATVFFNMISGFMKTAKMQRLIAAPVDLRNRFYELIDREIKHGKKGHIVAKMNSLLDSGIVKKLYEASQAGVRIELIVRGICVLVPGNAGESENITVRSLVGEFLEHSRIYYFEHSGLYLSSADWMPRNLDRRIELLFEVADPSIAERIMSILRLYLADDTKAWKMKPDGSYEKKQKGNVFAQEILQNIEYSSHEEFVKAIDAAIGKKKSR